MNIMELNLRQRRWVKLLKDYDCTIEYHPNKANVVADAFSQKWTRNLHYIHTVRVPLLIELRNLGTTLTLDFSGGIWPLLK